MRQPLRDFIKEMQKRHGTSLTVPERIDPYTIRKGEVILVKSRYTKKDYYGIILSVEDVGFNELKLWAHWEDDLPSAKREYRESESSGISSTYIVVKDNDNTYYKLGTVK